MKRTNNTHNRGTRLTNLPIQFHIDSVELTWQVVHRDNRTVFVGRCLTGVALETIGFGDGWELVRRFLSVRAEEGESIREFLDLHGRFEPPEGSIKTAWVKGLPPPVSLQQELDRVRKLDRTTGMMVVECFSSEEFETIQEYVRRMLIAGNPTLPTPWHVRCGQRYEIEFADARSGSQAHVLVRGVFPSILATVQFKLVQGAKFRTCARKDCRLPFEVTARHARRFCSQYCAHITSLRQRRNEERKNKTNKGFDTKRIGHSPTERIR